MAQLSTNGKLDIEKNQLILFIFLYNLVYPTTVVFDYYVVTNNQKPQVVTYNYDVAKYIHSTHSIHIHSGFGNEFNEMGTAFFNQ